MKIKLNFRSALFLLLSLLVLTLGCEEMKLSIQDSKERLDVLEETTITTINEQISAINTSISDLQVMDETLDAYIKTLDATATDLQKQINDANAEIAKVERELGDDISTLEQTLLNELNTAKEAIEAELLAINNTLAELKKADEALDKKISDLQTYVDTQLTSTTNWANATFSTLAQYEQTQAEISTIKASIEQINAGMTALETRLNGKIASDIQTAIDALRSELSTDYIARIESAVNTMTQAYTTAISSAKDEITSAYTNAIAKAIAESENNMQAWVNTLLAQGYYTISDINGKVSALEALIADGDNNLQKQINEQKTALQQAKTDLTNEYKQYINQAIASGGIIDQAIASQVKKAQDALQAQIDVINERLDSLEDRIGKLEEDFVNRIQSLKYIPEYSDRVVPVSDFYKTIQFDLLVSPTNLAEEVATAWKKDKNIITAYIRYTKTTETRAVSKAVQLNVSSLSVTSGGELSIVLKDSHEVPFDDDFLAGICPAVVYVRISDGNTDIVSDLVDVKVFDDEVIELSTSASANCYIVSNVGAYMFKPLKGNSSTSVGSVSSAVVLWETFGTSTTPSIGDLIKSVEYINGYIAFQTADSFKEGNAVIAAKDASANILWSWHIWFTDPPQGQKYYNNAGTMMDRNLGAMSATSGDLGSLGLLYQWGRKDPFLGSSSISSCTFAKSTIAWTTVSTSLRTGTVDYSIAHPTTFIYASSSPYDWHYSSRDNTLWTTSETSKSIYDPCPSGWRVPDGGDDGVWSKAIGSLSYIYNDINKGMNFSGKFGSTSTIWYPASGHRYSNVGTLYDVGSSGDYWSASPSGNYAHCLHFQSLGGWADPSSDYDRACGFSVRCVQE